MLEVVAGGPLSTIQDAGRADFRHLGVPPSGACDPAGLAIANLVIDNAAAAAAIEVTLGGLEVEVTETTVVGIGGADLGAVVAGEERSLASGASHLVWAGSTIELRGRPQGADRGARAYLAVPGGVDVPAVLGSASTCLVGRFGGHEGRRLEAGDRLHARRRPDLGLAGRSWPLDIAAGQAGPQIVRVVGGPHPGRFGAGDLARLTDTTWTAGSDSDRMGIRLAGPVSIDGPGRRELVSQPMVWGAVQVPADGAPIVLLADHQTVGGYPVLAVVIRADRPIIGQVAPGDRVRFMAVSLLAAQEAWRSERARLSAAALRLLGDERDVQTWRDAEG